MSLALEASPPGTPASPPSRGLSVLAEVIAGIASRPPLDETLQRPLELLGRILGAAECALAARPQAEAGSEEWLLVSAVARAFGAEIARAAHDRHPKSEAGGPAPESGLNRAFTQKIIDSLPLGLYVIDREYRIRAWNRRRETGMPGVSREEAMGRTIFEVLQRQSAEMLRSEFDEVFRTGRVEEYHMESRATGEPRTYRITKIPMRLGGSAVTHVITIGEDVTDWTEARRRFGQAEKLAAIGQLAAGVMHEINNPLAIVAACAQSLGLELDRARSAGGAIPERADEYLRTIGDEVSRCARTAGGLLDFSRSAPGVQGPVSLNEVIDRTMQLAKHHERFRRLSVSLELDAGVPQLPRADRDRLVQVFMALVLNAMDAVGDGGRIAIRTSRGTGDADGAVAEVVDQGHGIAGAELSKIFEPFYTTKEPGRGTGLGLAIAYGIIREHGGRIEVDSAPGQGSTFRVLLPIVERP